MKTKNETKPTAGAVRAAQIITKTCPEAVQQWAADVIDRETCAPRLWAALEKASIWMAGSGRFYCDSSQAHPDALTGLEDAIAEAEYAIAAAKGQP